MGVEMFTSLVDFMYDHCVFPLNQMVICGVVATNFVPFTDIVPDVLPTEPGLERAKRAVTPLVGNNGSSLVQTGSGLVDILCEDAVCHEDDCQQ